MPYLLIRRLAFTIFFVSIKTSWCWVSTNKNFGHALLSRGILYKRDVTCKVSEIDLSLEEIAAKWMTTCRTGQNLKSVNQTFIDQVENITVERSAGEGLGLLLEEMWQSEETQIRGLVLVSGVIDDSPAARSGAFKRGDTLISANGKDLEGLAFDTLVEELGSLSDDLLINFQVQRIVQRATVDVTVIDYDGTPRSRFLVPAGGNLRTAFLFNGFQNSDIYDSETMRFDALGNSGTNCGGDGTCGTCLISIIQGADLISPPGRVEKLALAKQQRPPRWRWSCNVYVGLGNRGGNITVGLRPQALFEDERQKTVGI
mmetsp:Transcript_16210/g.21197  ORF Transcript_16210/g.21197 Transcript_16210/m.21197 type:complete len:315 (+) Transcript_16210:89-1033(+)